MKHAPAVGRLLVFFAGAAWFAAVQTWLFQSAAPIAGIDDSGWFLNSGRGVEAIALTFAAAGAVVGLIRRDPVRDASLIAAGGAVTMSVVLFRIGPGTIFPIVLMFGAAIIATATAMGTGLGMLARLIRGETQSG